MVILVVMCPAFLCGNGPWSSVYDNELAVVETVSGVQFILFLVPIMIDHELGILGGHEY